MPESSTESCGFVFEPKEWQKKHNRLSIVDINEDSSILEVYDDSHQWKCNRKKATDKDYCLFHLEGRGEEKNEVFINDLNEGEVEHFHYIGSEFEHLNILEENISVRTDLDIDLRHCEISEDVDITSSEIPSNINFSGSKIRGDMSIFDSKINGDILFKNTIINGNIFIYNSRIDGSVDFSAATINGYIKVVESEITEILDFSETGLVNISVDSSDIGMILGDTIADIAQRIPDSVLK